MNNRTPPRYNTADPIRISRFLVTAILFVFTVVVAAYAIRTGSRVLMIALVALPFALMLISRLDLAYVGMLLLGATMVNLPGAADVPFNWVLLIFLVGVFFLRFLMRRTSSVDGEKLGGIWCLNGFIFVVIMLMAVRGAGLRMLGSATWGGTAYVILLPSLVFYCLVVPGIRIKKGQIKFVLWGGMALGLMGAFLQYFGMASGSGASVTELRALWLRPFIMAIIPVVFALVAPRRWLFSALLFFMCMALIMLTGFRSRFVMLVALAVGFGFFKSRSKAKYIAKVAVPSACLWILLVLISPKLPHAMQRSVSFVPGISIDRRVAKDAQGSIEWRMEIWDYAWAELPNYWLMGRGIAFDVRAAVRDLGRQAGMGGPFQAFHTHTYHSGPITMLVDFGVPGTLFFGGFMIFAFRTAWRIAGDISRKATIEYQYLLFLCVYLLWLIFAFWAVYGDVGSLSAIVMLMSQILIFYQSLKADEDEAGLENQYDLSDSSAADVSM